jgi:hypothetical protein
MIKPFCEKRLRKKEWLIYNYMGDIIGRLDEDKADDATDAVLNWADENLNAELKEVEDGK